MLPPGEIAALVIVCCLVLLGFVYLTYRCCRSLTKINRDANLPERVYNQAAPGTKFYSFQQTTGKAACTVTAKGQGEGQILPHRVTVSTVADLINEKSDLQPSYLTKPPSTPPHAQSSVARGMTRSPGFHEGLTQASRDAADDNGQASSTGREWTGGAEPRQGLFTEYIQQKDTAPLCEGVGQEESSTPSTHPDSRHTPYTDASIIGPHADTYI